MSRFKENSYPTFSEKNKMLFLNDKYLNNEMLTKLEHLDKKLMRQIEKYVSDCSPESDYSIYTGYCGIALLYLLKYNQTLDEKWLSDATQLTDNAVGNLKKKRISFLNGDAGPLALGAALHKLKGESNIAEDYINRLLKLSYFSDSIPDEVLYGRAGYLQSLIFAEKYCGHVIPKSHYKKVINTILQSGKKLSQVMKVEPPLYYMWHEKIYLGAAHGIAGIIFTLLLKENLLSSDDKNDIKKTLNWLEGERTPSGNPKSSESSSGDKLVQWCHGAPGFINLFLLAHKVYAEDKYLQLAKEMGDIVWERGFLAKGYSICHGVSGNAYSFLALFKATKDSEYLYRAACCVDYCFSHPINEGMKPDRPYSLFEGIAGISYFLNDMKEPQNASFPGYEI